MKKDRSVKCNATPLDKYEKVCNFCGKPFLVLYSEVYAYKLNHKYYCSYKHLLEVKKKK